MMTRRPFYFLLVALVVVVAVIAVTGCDLGGGEGPAVPGPTTTSSTTTTTVPEPEPAPVDCAALRLAQAGDIVTLHDDVLSDLNGEPCFIEGVVDGVTVTGSWTGDIICRGCDGWWFTDFDYVGSLRFIGGINWKVTNGKGDGGDRGIMAVLGTGSVDRGITEHPTPQNWSIDNVDIGGAGCRPANDPYPTHVRALYVIGYNGVPNNGFVTNSRFWGYDCGDTVKIGSTANFGVSAQSPDAADQVAFVGNTVEVLPVPDKYTDRDGGTGSSYVLVAGNSDNVTVSDNELVGPERPWAIAFGGPFTGGGSRVSGNTYQATNLILWASWNCNSWLAPFVGCRAETFAYQTGIAYATYKTDPCLPLGACVDNKRS